MALPPIFYWIWPRSSQHQTQVQEHSLVTHKWYQLDPHLKQFQSLVQENPDGLKVFSRIDFLICKSFCSNRVIFKERPKLKA